jgi:hypothetical protein
VNLKVVELDNPNKPLMTTTQISEAIAVCKGHPERGVLVHRRGGDRYVPIHHPRFDRSTLGVPE